MAIDRLDERYEMGEVCFKYGISRFSLRDHYESRIRQKKMGPRIVITKDEEEKLVECIELMVEWKHFITSMQLKIEVVEIIQKRLTPFKDGIPRNFSYNDSDLGTHT